MKLNVSEIIHQLRTLRWPSVRVPNPRIVAAALRDRGVLVNVEIETTGAPIRPVYGYISLAQADKPVLPAVSR